MEASPTRAEPLLGMIGRSGSRAGSRSSALLNRCSLLPKGGACKGSRVGVTAGFCGSTVSEVAESRLIIFDRPSSTRLSKPSGTGFSLAELSFRATPRPSDCAFSKSFFLARIASLNSSTRSDFFGPPVLLSDAFPLKILPLSSSGAT